MGSICSDAFSPSLSPTLMLSYWTRGWFSFYLEYLPLNSEVQRPISSCFLLVTYTPCPWLHPTHCCQVNLPKSKALIVHCPLPGPCCSTPSSALMPTWKRNDWKALAVKAFVSQTMAPFRFSLFFSMLLWAPERLKHHSTEVPYIFIDLSLLNCPLSIWNAFLQTVQIWPIVCYDIISIPSYTLPFSPPSVIHGPAVCQVLNYEIWFICLQNEACNKNDKN